MCIRSKIAAFPVIFMSSFVMADGSSDPVYGSMIKENENRWKEHALSTDQGPPEIAHYRYGMNLDIERVIHITSTRIGCGVMPAQMTYKDSNGDLKILEYRASGTKCRGNEG
ncbi:MAG: DUF2790 domain-containing protein [Halopseudomonas sp.]|uniref:DUF2790 domain-containing protein n=1 Tax=Halopseudomonas sp. TaxID=2901191 RepID=UPI0030030C8F